jgi:hypothetical protein
VHLRDDEKEAHARHLAAMTEAYRPRTDQQRWWVAKMAFFATRIDTCHELMPLDQVRVQERAEHDWDRDRQAEAEGLAARLPRDPRKVASALRRTRHGTQYLRESLGQLHAVVAPGGAWTEARRGLALDLLGIPHELRQDNPGLPQEEDAAGWTRLVGEQLGVLEELEAVHEAADARDRALAMAGLPIAEDAVTRRVRRAEAEAKRDLKRALDELLRLQALAPAQAKADAEEAVCRLIMARRAERRSPEPGTDAAPEPEPELEPLPLPRLSPPVLAVEPRPASDGPPQTQAERTRRDRRRRRMLERIERQKMKGN